jgi:hypothetical protein
MFINQWLLASETYRVNTMKKTLSALKVMGKHLKVAEAKEFHLRFHTDKKLIFALFYEWVASYNTRVSFREKLFRATAHWSYKT